MLHAVLDDDAEEVPVHPCGRKRPLTFGRAPARVIALGRHEQFAAGAADIDLEAAGTIDRHRGRRVVTL